MTDPMRILFVSDEVTPFSQSSGTAAIVRSLSEELLDEEECEMRVMMPRYGIVSVRKNRLHEVIRLSGTRIQMGKRKETLKVKVASIPGVRLQVYFMDSNYYFKRKGVYETAQSGDLFEDNLERALFFGRATLETIRKLGWTPDIIHAFGWMSGFVPMLLKTEYADDDIFGGAQSVFTPHPVSFDAAIDEAFIEAQRLPDAPDIADKDPNDVGALFADAAISLPQIEETTAGAASFTDKPGEQFAIARSVYERLLNEVAA